MELKSDDAAFCACLIVSVNTGLAIDECANVMALGDEFVLVPFAKLDVLFARLVPQQRAAVFFLQLAPPTFANIGLVAADFAVVYLAAKLDTTVSLIANELA
ncbi:hypothetical protein CA13_66420 [Planctomycetes bacterium CA13]|uniref:Uncharacterized protein n=1 Tax=Novipirellula herctigrandis TaxID=2527986 RepID=A0A5C5ZDC8_9BACT|nr:hypothetical protein CA13_66420 [Planctomycetes bacterium CA13]